MKARIFYLGNDDLATTTTTKPNQTKQANPLPQKAPNQNSKKGLE